MRLNKFLAHAGVASRRAAESLITDGRIAINGDVVTDLATTVDPDADTVTFDGKPLRLATPIWLALHKPIGYTCTAADPHAEHLALDLVPQAQDKHLFTVGRLDRDSQGLILVTNDGDLANKLLHPRYGVEKVYRANVTGQPQPRDMKRLIAGVYDDGDTLRAVAARIRSRTNSSTTVELVLAEGKNREVRRMFDSIGFPVRTLTRVAFGPIRLANLPPGAVRPLTTKELATLRAVTEPKADKPKRTPKANSRPPKRGKR